MMDRVGRQQISVVPQAPFSLPILGVWQSFFQSALIVRIAY